MSRRRKIENHDVSQVQKIQKEIRKANKEKRRIKRVKFLKRVFVLIFIVSIGIAVYVFDQSSYSRIRKIEVVGNENISEASILSSFKLKKNDRIIKAMSYKLGSQDLGGGVANSSLKLYYTKGQVTLTVQEHPVVGILGDDIVSVLFADNTLREVEGKLNASVPMLINFDVNIIDKYPEFSDKLSRMVTASFNSISEIEIIEEPLEDIYFKLTMNNGYFVHTNLNNLLLMDYYPDIVSGIQAGDKKDNKCIYFLDYGHTIDNQSAVSKPCPVN